MRSRSTWLAASGLVLIGAMMGADVGSATTPGAGQRLTVAAALGLDAPGAAADLDRRRDVAVAWQTARCMAGRGFVHIAVVEPVPEVPDGDLGPVAWAERWGFGISTAADLPASIAPPDPNLVRIAALPVEPRVAALRALLGDGQTPGCAALAGHEVHGLRDRELAPLRNELGALAAAIERDPGLRSALAVWRACVGTAADRPEHLASLLDAFRRRAEALQDLPSALTTLQDEERVAAASVARCEMAYGAARAHARARLEGLFVARHRAALATIGGRIRRVESAYPGLPGSDP